MSDSKYSLIVAWRITLKGDSTVSNDYSGLPGGNPIQQIGLIE